MADTPNTESSTAVEERPEQKVTVEDVGTARKKLTIELPESRIREKIESTYQTLSDDAVVPGFRRGRAPRRLIERRFGESIRGDVKGQLISEAYSQATEDEKLDVIGEPEVKDIETLELPASGSLTFEVEVEVSPQVDLPDFSTLEVDKPKAEVTDEDVDQEVERYQERMGQMTTVEDAEIASGDYVQCDVKVFEGDKPADDAEPILDRPGVYVLVHGEEQDYKGHVVGILVDDLGKRLMGKKADHVETISMTGPQGHEDERIKDKPITIRIACQNVQRLEPAAVEQVTQQFGFESLDELKAQMKPVLEQRAQQRQQAEMHRQVTEQLAEKVELELPEGLTGRQTERVLRRQAMELAYQGLSQDQVEERIAELRAGSEEEARRQLKLFFIINRAAEQLEIEVTEQEINGRLFTLAMQQGRRPEKLRQDMQRRGELEQLYMQIREQKTLDKIIEQAKVTEVDAVESDKPAAKPKKKTTKKKTTKKSTAKKASDDK